MYPSTFWRHQEAAAAKYYLKWFFISFSVAFIPKTKLDCNKIINEEVLGIENGFSSSVRSHS